jgi:hypothetical protein
MDIMNAALYAYSNLCSNLPQTKIQKPLRGCALRPFLWSIRSITAVSDEIALNIGLGEVLVGVEILDAKEILGAGHLPQVILENIPFQVISTAA